MKKSNLAVRRAASIKGWATRKRMAAARVSRETPRETKPARKAKLAVLVALVLGLAAPAFAQFAPLVPDGTSVPAVTYRAAGGPVAVGQAVAQRDDTSNRVAIVQAAPAAPATGGLLDLSSFGWLQPYATALVQSLIGLGFAIWGKGKYSTMMDAASRDALETFLRNRANSLIADGFVSLSGKTVKVENAALFRAAKEAETMIPKALSRFGLTPEIVAAKIVDAIPQTPVGAAALSNAHVERANIVELSAGGTDPTYPPTAPAT